MEKAVFIDKDGTLIRDIPYNIDPALISLSPGAGKALKDLKNKGFMVIVVTNQAGIAWGYFTEAGLVPVFKKINDLLPEGIVADDFYFCPHHPSGLVPEFSISCFCRKPNPGMLYRAAEEWNIDLCRSWMIGDILNDVEAGNRAGCRSILLDTGNETEWIHGAFRTPFFKVSTLDEAACKIISCDSITMKA